MKNNNIEDKFYSAKQSFQNSYGTAENSQAADLLNKIGQTIMQIRKKSETLRELDEEADEAYEQVRLAVKHKDKVMLASAEINYKDVLRKLKSV